MTTAEIVEKSRKIQRSLNFILDRRIVLKYINLYVKEYGMSDVNDLIYAIRRDIDNMNCVVRDLRNQK